LQAIRELPGENYLLDLELAQLDVILHRQLDRYWSAYVILSGVSYGGGFLDATIEGFHDTFGFGTYGRPAARRNDVNMLFDLKSLQYGAFEAPSSGGLLDPTLGIRHSGLALADRVKVVFEAAAKLPWAGRRTLLSSGRTDFGTQLTLQYFGNNHALYASASAVYFASERIVPQVPSQVIPTLVLGYEHRVTPHTNVILQGYVSPSIFDREQTDLDELLATKYQLSLGLRHRRGKHLVTFAVTENLQNINNTPDIGMQIGWGYVPSWK
jgi:hypothetical protein